MDGAGQNFSNPHDDATLRTSLLYGGATLLLVLASFFVLNYFNVVSLSEVFPSAFGWLPRQGVNKNLPAKNPNSSPQQFVQETPNLELCSITSEGNPLVDGEIFNSKRGEFDVTAGSFRGNINHYIYDSTSKTAQLDLVSPKGEQSHVFNLKEEKKLVFDATTRRDLLLSDLKRGETVVVSFNCFKSKDGKEDFKITRVAVIGKL